jgi:hypothetical protein
MTIMIRSFAAAALGLVLACRSPSQPIARQEHVDTASDPRVAGSEGAARHPHAVLRPTFMVGDKELNAGTAFVIHPKGHGPLLITAHHLFGPGGGLDRAIAWQDMPRAVRSVRARSFDDESVIVSGGAPLAVEGAEELSEKRVGGDLAIFPITEIGPARALELADAPPKVGDRVTLIAEVLSGGVGLRHGATVVDVGNDGVQYVFDERIELRATSGAPVVDAAERVIAVNLGGGTLDDGRVVGIGNSIAVVGPAIQRALAMGAQRP